MLALSVQLDKVEFHVDYNCYRILILTYQSESSNDWSKALKFWKVKLRLHMTGGVQTAQNVWDRLECNQGMGHQRQNLEHNQYERKYWGCRTNSRKTEINILHFEVLQLPNVQMQTVWQLHIDPLYDQHYLFYFILFYFILFYFILFLETKKFLFKT
jgi:hypothetical protein